MTEHNIHIQNSTFYTFENRFHTFSTKKYVSRETLGRNTHEKMVQYFLGVRSNLLLLRKGH